MNVQIHNMLQEETEAVVKIEEEAFSVPWTARGFLDALTQQQNIFLTAVSDGEVAGYCGLYVAADEGEITNVAVKGVYRRQGIASCLIEEVLRRAWASGITQIFLEVRRSNLPAQNLYQKHGFRPQGIRKNFYRCPAEDAVVMICQPGISTVEEDADSL